MLFSFKRAAQQSRPFSIFGKLPHRGDFVRIHATHPDILNLDTLLGDGLQLLAKDAESLRHYQSTASAKFVLRSAAYPGAFVGAMVPSRDGVGRHYPIVAGCFYPEEQLSAPLAQFLLASELLFSGLKEQLVTAVENSVDMVACRNFLEEQVQREEPSAADLELARQLLEQHMEKGSARQLDAVLRQTDNSDLESVLLDFFFYPRSKTTSELSASAYVLPLSAKSGEDILMAATWLSLYQAASPRQDEGRPQCFLLDRHDGRFLVLLPGSLTARHILLCLGGSINDHAVADVVGRQFIWRHHPAYAEVAYSLGRRLNDPAVTVAELRDLIRNISVSVG